MRVIKSLDGRMNAQFSLLLLFYIRLQALVQTEHLSMHESFRLEIGASCHLSFRVGGFWKSIIL